MMRQAFTIVELAIAMAFISFLILAIGTVNTQIAQIYQKGLTLKSVNDTSRELTDEFVTAIEDAVLKAECEEERNALACNYNSGGSSVEDYLYNKLLAFKTLGGTNTSVPVYGAFCTGKYSYVWNSGYVVNEEMDRVKYISFTDFGVTNSGTNLTSFRLLRVNDASGVLCKPENRGGAFPPHAPSSTNPVILQIPDSANPTELLTNSEDNLALYDLTIFPTTYHQNTGHSFVSGTYILGTVTNDPKNDVSITTLENICSGHPTDNFTTDFVYCSINRFNFAGRAGGKSRSS